MATSQTMYALCLYPDSTLHYDPVAIPTPSANQILVRVSSTALTRSELTWSETLARSLPIPGHDVSGTVVAAPSSSKFKAGDEVFALIAFNRDGAAAEYVVALEEELSLKPHNLSYDEAAAMPLSALTAWQALFEHAGLKAGSRLLVTAAAGSVGVMGVQLGKWAGAYVLGTCSKKNTDLIKRLGADSVVDYADGGFETWAREVLKNPEERVDVVLDCIGGETLKKCFSIMKRGGAVVSIAQPIDEEWPEVKSRSGEDVKSSFFVVKSDGSTLDKIRELVEMGSLKPVVDRVVKVRDGMEASKIVEGGHVTGKVVLNCKT